MKSYEHLSYQESLLIYQNLCAGKSRRSIAKAIARSASTISRELHRHSDKIGYHPPVAATVKTRSTKRIRKIDADKRLREYVLEKLASGWSPGAISGRWNREHQKQTITSESIYTWIYLPENEHLMLYKKLPRAKRKRGIRRVRAARSCYDRAAIHIRPESINNRSEVGHYEADLMFNAESHSAHVLTMIDRKTRHVKLIKNASKHSDIVIRALEGRLDKTFKSVTFDNGSEFAQHKRLKSHGIQTFFCDPGCPWQKGSIEHLNGMLRRYLPFKLSSTLITQKLLDEIENSINNTPRKSLGFLTPCEFTAQCLQAEIKGCCTSNLT